MRTAAEARERILRAAEPLFLQHGLSRVTMDDIAAALRMSKKTLYQHFAGKEELFAAAIDRAVAAVDAELERVIEAEDLDFGEKLTRITRVVGARFEGAGPLLRDLTRESPELHERVQGLRRAVIQRRVGALFEAGVAEGAIRADVRPELVLRMVLAVGQHVIEPRALEDLGMEPVEAYRQVMSVILDGVRAQPEGRAQEGKAKVSSKRPG